MHAQEIDLRHRHALSVYVDVDRDARNESKEFIFLSSSHTEQPIFLVPWRSQRPLQELHRIVESEHCIIIFYIILC